MDDYVLVVDVHEHAQWECISLSLSHIIRIVIFLYKIQEWFVKNKSFFFFFLSSSSSLWQVVLEIWLDSLRLDSTSGQKHYLFWRWRELFLIYVITIFCFIYCFPQFITLFSFTLFTPFLLLLPSLFYSLHSLSSFTPFTPFFPFPPPHLPFFPFPPFSLFFLHSSNSFPGWMRFLIICSCLPNYLVVPIKPGLEVVGFLPACLPACLFFFFVYYCW